MTVPCCHFDYCNCRWGTSWRTHLSIGFDWHTALSIFGFSRIHSIKILESGDFLLLFLEFVAFQRKSSASYETGFRYKKNAVGWAVGTNAKE